MKKPLIRLPKLDDRKDSLLLAKFISVSHDRFLEFDNNYISYQFSKIAILLFGSVLAFSISRSGFGYFNYPFDEFSKLSDQELSASLSSFINLFLSSLVIVPSCGVLATAAFFCSQRKFPELIDVDYDALRRQENKVFMIGVFVLAIFATWFGSFYLAITLNERFNFYLFLTSVAVFILMLTSASFMLSRFLIYLTIVIKDLF